MRAILLNGAARSKCASEAMWETTFPRNSHAGLVKDFTKVFHTREYVSFVKWPTQSAVAISRKCRFPHGSEVDSKPWKPCTTCGDA